MKNEKIFENLSLENIHSKLINFSNYVANNHSNNAIKTSGTVRGHDRQTPYYTHPIACAFMVLEDNNSEYLTFERRLMLAISLLGHDLIEDTNLTKEEVENELISIFGDKEFAEKITSNILLCTIDSNMSSMDEFKHLVDHKQDIIEDIWYIKTVDKWFNLFGSKEYFIKKNTLGKYCEFLDFLSLQLSETNYKDSMFVSQSNSLTEELSKFVQEA